MELWVNLAWAIAASLLGLIAGSFITVLLHRTRHGGTIVWGRSHCVSCKKALGAIELVPLASFFAQRGKCRSCKRPIPVTYPLIEFFTAFFFGIAGWLAVSDKLFTEPLSGLAMISGLSADGLAFFYFALFIGTAISVSFYDVLYFEIPTAFLLPAVILASFAHGTDAFLTGNIRAFGIPLLSGTVAFLAFWLLWFLSRGRAMGRGDADVAFAIVFALGPILASAAILASFWLGAAYGILMLVLQRARWKSRIPFAPFLFGGGLASMLAARPLLHFVRIWYGF